MKPEKHLEAARAIARALHVSLFDRCGYDPKAIAQRNLSGKTHYVDDDTLRFFHSRINYARVSHDGLIFALVESVARDFENTSRGFRFVVFDLFGTVINDRDSADATHSKSDKAHDALNQWLSGFDALAHYKTAMLERAERMKREASDMAKVARSIRTARKAVQA